MSKVEWRLTECPYRLWLRIKQRLMIIKLTYHTLTFNSFTTWSYVFETAMEPLFWFVDHFAKYLGPIFVLLVVSLTTSVVVVFYLCILPDIFQQSVPWTIFHLIFGHWLLMNIVFHYVMAAFTDPGKPPPEVPQTISVCKKCVSPKPPRTHHCSICGQCVLKMDHHCPWLNNCVGFFNHRYFFLFCVYMWLGTVYVSVTGYDLFREHFYGSRDVFFPGALFPLNMAHEAFVRTKQNDTTNEGDSLGDGHMVSSDWSMGQAIHGAIIYEFMLCSGVVLALGLLTLWHARLIAAGQTSIEAHINKKELKKHKAKGLVYKNPYDFGWRRNWEIFLGLEDGRTFLRHVLLPSTHTPFGEGLIWRRSTHPATEQGPQIMQL